MCFPRLYAAASLKQHHEQQTARPEDVFSAALCRGLIEAVSRGSGRRHHARSFSAALCRGLIEADGGAKEAARVELFSAALCRGLIEAVFSASPRSFRESVFRGFMPRPH